MYGNNYGYRSGLNRSMVKHLERRIRGVRDSVALIKGDVVIDIGSNDGTSLGFYPRDLQRIGIDPTAKKFQSFYPAGVIAVSDFFSAEVAMAASSGEKAKAITAFSMLYDLEDPIAFAKDISAVLADDGIFVFEQSYMPLMLERVAFDTICHEHVEYYGLRQIDFIMREARLEVVDVELNDVNGGSFTVTAAHIGARTVGKSVSNLRVREASLWASPERFFDHFAIATKSAAEALRRFVSDEVSLGKTIAGLGASTKGNVLLQFAGIDSQLVSVIGDVNPDKYGCVTPGSWIPIVPEEEVLDLGCDYYLVLPWHFREFFTESNVFRDRNLVFPLPRLEIVSRIATD